MAKCERVHKILAHAGFGSRRACEDLIEEGQVTVNGRAITVGDKADPETDEIRVGGQRVRREPKVYYLLNKPPGVICTNDDPFGRKTAREMLEPVRERVYPVGRLDADSRGLLILTNDGDLAARLTHPKYEVPKTYEAEVDGRVVGEDVEKLTSGVWLSEGRTSRAQVRILKRGNARSLLEVTLREGRNRQVRRMLAKLGHKVRRLTRARIGKLTLHGLGIGKWRQLNAREVEYLYKLTEQSADEGGSGRRGKGKPRKPGKRTPSRKPKGSQRPAKGEPPKSQGTDEADFTF